MVEKYADESKLVVEEQKMEIVPIPIAPRQVNGSSPRKSSAA
jgi:hypothetical protein